MTDCLSRVETLRAYVHAVLNAMAPEDAEGVVEPSKTLISGIDAVGVESDGFGFVHAVSMAWIGVDCKRLCAPCHLSQLMEYLNIRQQHTIQLSWFVTLSAFLLITP